MSDESNPANGGSDQSSTPPWQDPSLPAGGYPQWQQPGDSGNASGRNCGCLVLSVVVIVVVVVGVALGLALAR